MLKLELIKNIIKNNTENKQAKIIIIGAKGMLGQELAAVFADFKPILLDRAEIDICDAAAVESVITALQPKYIINAAAYTAVDDCETNQELANQVNGVGPGNLAQLSKKLGAVLLHYSTDYIFNGESAAGYREDCKLIQPLNAYGKSKALGEKMIQENLTEYYIVRTAWLYGKNGKNFVDTIIKLAQEKPELKIVNDQHGSPTYVKDLAQTTRALLLDIKPPFGIYHVTNSGVCTWFEFAQEILRLKQFSTPLFPCASADFPRPAPRPRWSVLLNTKLPAMRSWQNALAEYLK